MSTRQLHLRIFLASPGDVADERAVARSVIDQTQYNPEWRGVITFETIAWDKPGAVAMLASATPQASVAHQLPKPSECDIVIVIFWARPGSPLPANLQKPDGTPYVSGTEWEYLDALQAAEKAHRPRVLLYRRTEEPVFHASDPTRAEKLEHWEWVNNFFASLRAADGSFTGGYTGYSTPDEFRRHLEGHLRSTIHDFAIARDFVPSVVLAHRPLLPLWEGSPFPGLRAFTPKDSPIFFGRGREIDELVRRLEAAGEGTDPVIEVAHEALLTNWPRLEKWIERVLDDVRLRSQLRRAAVEWAEHGRDATYQWSDERCVAAHRGLQRLQYEPSRMEKDFLGPLDCGEMLRELDDSAIVPERRAVLGVRLALLGDPRQGVGLRHDGLPDLAWCEVPGGRITASGREIDVERCYITKYPVTAAQYDVFARAPDGYCNPGWWDGLVFRDEQPGRQYQRYTNHPADNVSWVDATAYCRWLTSRLGYEVRLPTEWEWQQAANGGDCGKDYPWGAWELGRANTYEAQLNRTTAVGMFPHGASPVGALDICGNVWEWCSDISDLYDADENCPFGYRAVRGGAWNFVKTIAGCAFPNGECSAYRFTSVGFRIACSSPG